MKHDTSPLSRLHFRIGQNRQFDAFTLTHMFDKTHLWWWSDEDREVGDLPCVWTAGCWSSLSPDPQPQCSSCDSDTCVDRVCLCINLLPVLNVTAAAPTSHFPHVNYLKEKQKRNMPNLPYAAVRPLSVFLLRVYVWGRAQLQCFVPIQEAMPGSMLLSALDCSCWLFREIRAAFRYSPENFVSPLRWT